MHIQILGICLFVVGLVNLCQLPEPVDNFDIDKYTGDWYERMKYLAVPVLGYNWTCVKLNIMKNSNDTATLNRTGNDGNSTISIHGLAVPDTNKTNLGKFSVTFWAVRPTPYPYVVLDTDYDNYAISYTKSCISDTLAFEFIHLYTRNSSTPSETYTNALNGLDSRLNNTFPFAESTCEFESW